jgi:hypothetical protein
MTTALAKQVKGSTSAVRQHLEIFERAREVYLGAIKRAEADYFERIKRATSVLAGEAESAAPEAPSEPSSEVSAPPPA